MKNISRFVVSIVLMLAFCVNILPCGPAYVSPIFEYEHAPENPYENFAAGKLGVLMPSQRRIVLIAAYRYLNGGGFSDAEQKALVEVWNADFSNKPYKDDDISEAVKKWIEKRAAVVGKEEKPPEIYVERPYSGGYDFFPNCTKNAFETATETLADRTVSHGSDDKDVKDWVRAQDKVFENCASNLATPDAPNEAMPEWLQKDRAYQTAAAEFYAMDYDGAKRHFGEIARDDKSPWRETAEYLVGRTLIRQASLSKDKTKTDLIYTEAEQNLSAVAIKGNKFSESAEKMIGLIKYRTRPQERVRELAQTIAVQGNSNFRQDLIDYNWLLDKFAREAVEAEDKRRNDKKSQEEEFKRVEKESNSIIKPENPDSNSTNSNSNANVTPGIPDMATLKEQMSRTVTEEKKTSTIYFYSDDDKESWSFEIEPTATDEEAFAKAETVAGRKLTERMKTQIRDGRKEAYKGRFDGSNGSEYEGGYYDANTLSLAILPDYLRLDDLSNWLFTFQTNGVEAYNYALSQYRQNYSVLWLLTAISKADKSSAELNGLLEAANKIDRNSVAYPTIAFHQARILIEQGKTAEARKTLDDLLNSADDLPISTRNKFLKLRVNLAESLDDFLKFSQQKPFAFDFDGESGTIDDIINEQKSWYSAENYPNQTREEYEKEVESRFANEKLWENRTMLDYDTTERMNQHFPLNVLIDAEKSPALPDYMRKRFALAIWTRAILLNDFATAQKIAPEALKFHAELQELMTKIDAAPTPLAKQRAALFLILKNPMLTPFLEDGFGKTDNTTDTFDSNDWWCAPYNDEIDPETGTTVKMPLPPRPAFLTAAQTATAQAERKKIAQLGDAPKFMGEKVLEWARLAPADKRVPESLYIVWQANGWRKYGCGNNEELRTKTGDLLKRKYPQSEWTQKLIEEEKDL